MDQTESEDFKTEAPVVSEKLQIRILCYRTKTNFKRML